jgi:dGTPase
VKSPDFAEGLRAGLAPAFEVQVVVLADRIASALHDLDDALQADVIDLARVERLAALRELRRKLGRRYPATGGRFVRANAIHRGLTHLMVTATILVSDRQLTRWADRHDVRTASDFARVRDGAVQGTEVGVGRTIAGLLDELEGFLESHVRRGFEVERVEGRGRRILLGLFAAYHADPALLEDHVLFRFKEIAGGRFLRDLPWAAREGELDTRYRGEPRFSILLADHLAGMTDVYALREHERLIAMGAVPIPGAEALRTERLRQRNRMRPSPASIAKGKRLD